MQALKQCRHCQLLRTFRCSPFQTGLFVHIGCMVGTFFYEIRVGSTVGMVLSQVFQQVQSVIGKLCGFVFIIHNSADFSG